MGLCWPIFVTPNQHVAALSACLACLLLCLSVCLCVCLSDTQSTSEPRVSWLEEQLRNLGMADGPAGTGLMMGSLCAGKFSLDGNW